MTKQAEPVQHKVNEPVVATTACVPPWLIPPEQDKPVEVKETAKPVAKTTAKKS